MPETNVRAIVKSKIIKKHNYYICFQFPDGTDKVLKVEPEIYQEIQENETGTLSYKEHIPFMERKGFEMMRIENKTIENEIFLGWEQEVAKDYRVFINFEKDI